MTQTTPESDPTTIADILAWSYTYRFTDDAANYVDIDLSLTLRKHDDTPIIAGASLFAAGDTTPSGLIAVGPGDYTVSLPIRRFHAVRWNPAGTGKAPKRYLLNFKLTAVSDDEFEAPQVYAFLGVTVGFRTVARTTDGDQSGLIVNGVPLALKAFDRSEIDPAGDLREALAARREAGFNLLRLTSGADPVTDELYGLGDELGLLIRQTIDIATPAETQMLIRQIRHHPSLAILSGDPALAEYAAAEAPEAVYYTVSA